MRQEIESVVRKLLEADAWTLITPGVVYHAMRKRGKCCGCFPKVVDLIVETTLRYHEQCETPEVHVLPFIERIRSEHERCETARMLARKARRRDFAA